MSYVDQEPTFPEVERRRSPMPLTEEQIDHIAKKAAEQAVAMMETKFYVSVGKGVANRFIAMLGLFAVIAVAWFSGHGIK